MKVFAIPCMCGSDRQQREVYCQQRRSSALRRVSVLLERTTIVPALSSTALSTPSPFDPGMMVRGRKLDVSADLRVCERKLTALHDALRFF